MKARKPVSVELWRGTARGVAGFFGIFSLVNLLGEVRARGFDANCWWIDFRPAPAWVGKAVLAAVAGTLLAFAARPAMSAWRRRITVGLLVLILGVATGNSLNFFGLLFRGQIRSSFPIPLSLVVGLAIGIVLAGILRRIPAVLEGEAPFDGRTKRWLTNERVIVVLAVLACVVTFPLLQMLCFGKTDYGRRGEVAVVFGARAHADGRPSQALADRVRTGCRLFQEEMVDALIFSGGPGDGEIDEPEAMKRMAVELGVPADRIILDHEGLNTDATVRNTAGIFRDSRTDGVLVVSHFYHLPRVKLTYQRAGIEVYTVPAEETRTLSQMPKLIVREVAALWVYYLRPLLREDDEVTR